MEDNTDGKPQRKNAKKLVRGLGIVFLLLSIALLGLKWHGQIQEYKNIINQGDQKIARLQQDLRILQEAGEPNKIGSVKTLQLTDWGVEIPLDENSSTFSVSLDKGYYYFKSEITGCWVDGKDSEQPISAVVAAMSRLSRDETISNEEGMVDKAWVGRTWGEYYENYEGGLYSKATILGDYIYVLSGPQQGCGISETEVGKAANDRNVQLTEELLELFGKLRNISTQD